MNQRKKKAPETDRIMSEISNTRCARTTNADATVSPQLKYKARTGCYNLETSRGRDNQ